MVIGFSLLAVLNPQFSKPTKQIFIRNQLSLSSISLHAGKNENHYERRLFNPFLVFFLIPPPPPPHLLLLFCQRRQSHFAGWKFLNIRRDGILTESLFQKKSFAKAEEKIVDERAAQIIDGNIIGSFSHANASNSNKKSLSRVNNFFENFPLWHDDKSVPIFRFYPKS